MVAFHKLAGAYTHSPPSMRFSHSRVYIVHVQQRVRMRARRRESAVRRSSHCCPYGLRAWRICSKSVRAALSLPTYDAYTYVCIYIYRWVRKCDVPVNYTTAPLPLLLFQLDAYIYIFSIVFIFFSLLSSRFPKLFYHTDTRAHRQCLPFFFLHPPRC